MQRVLVPAVLVAIAALAVYANALQNDFVSDDTLLLVQNKALAQPGPIWQWFRRDYFYGTPWAPSSMYRPLTILSHVALLRLTGLTAWTFHLANVLLHAAVSLAVWVLGRRLLGPPAALAGALLFAVHPLHTEAVTSIVGRAELLAALGALAAALAFLQAAVPRTPHFPAWALAASGAFLLALFSKEHVATLPAWCGLAWLLDRKRLSGRRAALLLGLLALVLLGFLLLRSVAVQSSVQRRYPGLSALDNPAFGISAPRRWLTAAAVSLRYFGLFLWPQALSAEYGYAQILPSHGLGLLELGGLLLIGLCLGAILVTARRAPGLALSLAFVPITFFIVSNFPFPIHILMAERVTYLPSVGLCLLAGWALARLEESSGILTRLTESGPMDRLTPAHDNRHSASPVAAVFLAGLIVALGIRTVIRNTDWRDQYTIVRAAYDASPKSVKVLSVLAQQEASRGNEEWAQTLLEEARTLLRDGFLNNPDLARAASAYAERLIDRNQPLQAAALFEAILRNSPNDPRALTGMARAHLMLGRVNLAREYASRVVALGARLPRELAEQLGLSQ